MVYFNISVSPTYGSIFYVLKFDLILLNLQQGLKTIFVSDFISIDSVFEAWRGNRQKELLLNSRNLYKL